MKKDSSILSRHPVLDGFCELLVALAIVSGVIAAAFFFDAHKDASWMPSPEARQHIGWSVMGFGLGAMYLYLAMSTRRLEQRVWVPQLRQLLNFGQRWYVSLGIGGLCFILGLASLWPIIQRHKATLPTTEKWTFSAVGFQILAGLVWVVLGASLMKLRSHLRSRNSQKPKHQLAYEFVFIGMVVYGALRFCSGLWLLLK